MAWNRGMSKKNSEKMRIIAEKSSRTQREKHHSSRTEFKKGNHYNFDDEFKKGNVAWNKDLTKENCNKIKEMANKTSQTRKNLFKTGKMKTNAESQKGKHHSPKTEIKKGDHLSPETEFTSEKVKQKWQNAEWKERQIKAVLKGLFKRPTSVEREFIEIAKNHNFPYKYVGDGAFLIGYKNPDFIHTNEKKICIEVAARIFHNPNDVYEKGRKKHFGNYGWKCFVFWANKRGLEDKEKIVEILQEVI